jgi:hypothetical protein
MKKLAVLAVLACAAAAAAQDTTTTTTTTTKTTRSAAGEVKTTTTSTGKVVRYEPGRTLVVEYPKQKTVTYELAPGVVIGDDVRAGSEVQVFLDPAGGSSPGTVRKVTTLRYDKHGRLKKSTTTTTTASSNLVVGTVKAYVPGQTLTVAGEDGDVTYYLDSTSVLPPDIAVGRVIEVEPLVLSATEAGTVSTKSPVVKRVTYHETTTTITKRKINY